MSVVEEVPDEELRVGDMVYVLGVKRITAISPYKGPYDFIIGIAETVPGVGFSLERGGYTRRIGAYLASQEDEKDGLEEERDDARSERDSARYVVESAAHYLARGDVAGAMAVLQEDVASRKYEAGSQQQDSLKGLAAQLEDQREWRRVGRKPSEGNGGAR